MIKPPTGRRFDHTDTCGLVAMRAVIAVIVALVALLNARVDALGQANWCANQPPRACEITPFTEWTRCFPPCLLPGEPSGSRSQIRIRGVLQYSCPEEELCPPYNVSMREYRTCPDVWCTPLNLQCKERCVGCQYPGAYPVLSQDWCRCCANQDAGGRYYRNNVCSAFGRSGDGALRSISPWDPPSVGCNYLDWGHGFSTYLFDNCLNQGFCAPVNGSGGQRGCQQFGYCGAN